jgi:anthranilate synthase/aminodeoxychorismate synthase-like glutamine amidotransferase
MLLVIDNYDSFVFNLARYLVELGYETQVVRNDAISVADVRELKPEAIVLSPGPGTPADAGACVELVRELAGEIPMLGVCLGHQAIAAAFGADIIRATEPVHGRTSAVHHDGTGLFEGLPDPLVATRYHSLIVDADTLPDELQVTARTGDGIPMALAHRALPIYGVQFHPESVLTRSGPLLLANFVRLCGLPVPVGQESPGDFVGRGPKNESARDDVTIDQPLHW